MRIGGFYIITTKGYKTCSTGGSFNRYLTSEAKCKEKGGVWDYHSPYGESTFKRVENIPDEKGEDFYWTGVLRQSFTEGVPGEFNYKQTCSDGSYDNQKDCEDSGAEWSHRGWESGEEYKKNDLVYYYGYDDEGNGPQKVWYYCITDNNGGSHPVDGDGDWRGIDLKSYLYTGPDNNNWEPDAWHAYDRQLCLNHYRRNRHSLNGRAQWRPHCPFALAGCE